MIWPVVIYCIFRIAAVFTAEEIIRSVYTISWQNKRLSGKAVKNIDSPSLMSCSQLCLRHSWFTSTNFQEAFGKGSESNCELNKHDFNAINDETKLMDQPGTAFTSFLKVDSYKKSAIIIARHYLEWHARVRNSFKILSGLGQIVHSVRKASWI